MSWIHDEHRDIMVNAKLTGTIIILSVIGAVSGILILTGVI